MGLDPRGDVIGGVSTNAIKTTFNAGDPIQSYMDIYNNASAGESAYFDWSVYDPWGRWVPELAWSGNLNSGLGATWWELSRSIPTHAITGEYTFTGSITHNERTTSASVTFHVNGPAGPSNDNIAAPTIISSIPYNVQLDTWGATVAADDPVPSCGSGQNSNSVWYRYTPPANGILHIDTWSSNYDTVVAIWTGSPGNLTEYACNDNNYSVNQSWLETPVTGGTVYYIEVMDYDIMPGGGYLNLYVDFARPATNDDFGSPTTIAAIPFNSTLDTRAATKASDDPDLTACNRLAGQASVWYRFTPTVSGELGLDTKGSDYDTMLAVWTGERGHLTSVDCNDDIGWVNEEWDQDSRLTVSLAPGTTYYIEVSQFNGYIDTSGASAQKVSNKPTEISAQFTLGGSLHLNALFKPFPGAFNKSSPANGATNQLTNPTLSWGASSYATSYEYCIDTTSNTDCDASWISVGASTSIALSSLTPGTYYWQVRANNDVGSIDANGGTWWSFTILPVPGAFNKSSPTNGATNQPANPTLSWGASSSAVYYQYCIDTTNDNACTASWISTGTSKSVALSGLTPGTRYWQVRARNSTGTTYANGNSTAWWSFTILPVPGAFNKSSPANGATNQTTNPTLSWGASSSAVYYEYCYDTTNDNACSTWTSNGTATSKALSGLKRYTTYYWQVRAVNSYGITYASGGVWWSFKTVPLTASFQSVGTYDGWVLESSETSSTGGSLNATGQVLLVGDNALKRQYRSILSFDTASLPDTAVITQVVLKVMQQSIEKLMYPSNVGENPFTVLGGLNVDIRKPYFGLSVSLEAGDFQATAGKTGAGTFGATPVSGWYTASLGATGYPFVNLSGPTQFRLQFALDDNNNGVADYVQLYSGNATTAANRPVLIVKYYLP